MAKFKGIGFKEVHRFLESLFQNAWHARRVCSLANATLGIMAGASLLLRTHTEYKVHNVPWIAGFAGIKSSETGTKRRQQADFQHFANPKNQSNLDGVLFVSNRSGAKMVELALPGR